MKFTNSLYRQLYQLIKGIPPVTHGQIDKETIRELVGKPNPVILEIGCHDGANTQWFLEMFDSAKIHCFEPDPRAVKRFRERIGDDARVELHQIAVSDKEGTATFYQSNWKDKNQGKAKKDWDASGSIREPLDVLDKFPKIAFEHTIEVRTTTLDKFCEEHRLESIDFIWMDVQGAEIDVFRGGKRTLFDRTRYLYTEYGLSELYKGQITLKEILKYLKGFEVITRYPGDVLLRNSKLQRGGA